MARKPLNSEPLPDAVNITHPLGLHGVIVDKGRARRGLGPVATEVAVGQEHDNTAESPAPDDVDMYTRLHDSKHAILQEDIQADLQASNIESKLEGRLASLHEILQASLQEGRQESKPNSDFEDRLERAREIIESDVMVPPTFRVPAKIDEYIQKYCDRRNQGAGKRNRYTKQEAAREMFAWFYAAHPLPALIEEDGEL